MAARKFRPCKGCDGSPVPRRQGIRCYEERKLLQIAVDLEMGTPVEIILKHDTSMELAGYYLRYNQQHRSIHFQPFGESEVQEIELEEICILKYSA